MLKINKQINKLVAMWWVFQIAQPEFHPSIMIKSIFTVDERQLTNRSSYMYGLLTLLSASRLSSNYFYCNANHVNRKVNKDDRQEWMKRKKVFTSLDNARWSNAKHKQKVTNGWMEWNERPWLNNIIIIKNNSLSNRQYNF